MKKVFGVLIIVLVTFFSTLGVSAYSFTDGPEEIYICNGDECGFEEGINLIKDSGIDGLQSDGTASDFIQQIVIYLLSFISLIAVIYIIYAGFRILTSAGDEETLKKSKTTILYVIIGILIIWFAWAITKFAFSIGGAGEGNNSSTNTNSQGQTCGQRFTQSECEDSTFGLCNWDGTSCGL